MSIDFQDQVILRDLARQVREIAQLPIMAERRELWRRHNRLERVRPLVLVFPEGSWRELLPETALHCTDERARALERQLRMRVYYHENFYDDTVIEGKWIVNKAVTNTGWGLEPRHHPSTTATGAWGFDPVIATPADLKKLRHPEVIYDEAATERNLAEAQEIFGGILDVQLKGISHVSFHLMSVYSERRGLEQAMVDMIANPGMLHDAMAFLEEGYRGLVRQYQEINLLSLNNDSTYHSSGGVGYTNELPAAGFDPDRVRPCDMWSSAESQELAQVSPAMHAEFALPYEKRLLAPFGLNGYGCCEDLTDKLDDVFTIPHIRRISIAPWADVDRCAEKLQGRAIFSWKPNPAHLVGEFDEEHVRAYIQHTIEAAQECVLEIILKDTHTCENHPERFTQWTAIAHEQVEC
jgi:hypothetical protein